MLLPGILKLLRRLALLLGSPCCRADARERYERASDGRRKGYSVHASDRTPDQPVYSKDVVRPMGGRDGRLPECCSYVNSGSFLRVV